MRTSNDPKTTFQLIAHTQGVWFVDDEPTREESIQLALYGATPALDRATGNNADQAEGNGIPTNRISALS